MPTGEKLYELEFPNKNFRNVVLTSDGSLIVGPGYEKLKDTLFIFNAKTGLLVQKIVLKYNNFKDYLMVISVPRKATQVKAFKLIHTFSNYAVY